MQQREPLQVEQEQLWLVQVLLQGQVQVQEQVQEKPLQGHL